MTSKRRATALCCAADGTGRSVSRPAGVSEEQLRVTCRPWWIQLGTHLPKYSHTPLSSCTPQECSTSPGSEAATEVSSTGSPSEEEENGKGNRRCCASRSELSCICFSRGGNPNAQASHPTCARTGNPASANDNPSSFGRRMSAARRSFACSCLLPDLAFLSANPFAPSCRCLWPIAPARSASGRRDLPGRRVGPPQPQIMCAFPQATCGSRIIAAVSPSVPSLSRVRLA